jgi:hypothetical protein
VTACAACGFPLAGRAPGAAGRPRRRCVGCVRRRRADAERRRRARAGIDLGLSPRAWARLELTGAMLADVAKHGVVDPDAHRAAAADGDL